MTSPHTPEPEQAAPALSDPAREAAPSPTKGLGGFGDTYQPPSEQELADYRAREAAEVERVASTPRTDKEIARLIRSSNATAIDAAVIHFARTLELELAAMTTELDAVAANARLGDTAARAEIERIQTLWGEAVKRLDAMTSERDGLLLALQTAERNFSTMTSERDALLAWKNERELMAIFQSVEADKTIEILMNERDAALVKLSALILEDNALRAKLAALDAPAERVPDKQNQYRLDAAAVALNCSADAIALFGLGEKAQDLRDHAGNLIAMKRFFDGTPCGTVKEGK